MLFSSLPTDIINHILSYNGSLKLRNRKYMGQISTSDKRYELLLNISRKIYNIPSIPSNYCYLHVNNILTIRIYEIHYYSSQQPMYNYVFGNRNNITYIPK